MDGDVIMCLGIVAVVLLLFLGAALEAWMDYREDMATRREWEEQMRARKAAGVEPEEEADDLP